MSSLVVKGLLALLIGTPIAFAGCTVIAAGADTTTPRGAAGSTPGKIPGIPKIVLDAYVNAAAVGRSLAPRCHGVRWQILAGIGRIESQHAAGRRVDPGGLVSPPILGPRLDGRNGTRRIGDTDNGRWDRDRAFDRAVGAMQFLPGTWRSLGRDGNRDGRRDPNNVFDAAAAAVVHLCGTKRRDLSDPGQLRRALYGYNPSWGYVRRVYEQIAHYDTYTGVAPVRGSGKGARILAAAAKWLGWPYSYAGGNEHGPTYGTCCTPSGKDGSHIKGFDCSGITIYALAQVGIRGVVHSATWQYNNAGRIGGRQLPPSRGRGVLRPGDLVFFGSASYKHHVGIYAGNGRMLHAPRPGRDVSYGPLASDYAGAVTFDPPGSGTVRTGTTTTGPVLLTGVTRASYFWDDGSGRNGDTGAPASGMRMQKGLAASPSWPLGTTGYVQHKRIRRPFVIGDRGPGAPSSRGIMLDLDARTFADLTGGRFDPGSLTVRENSGTGHIRIAYTITHWGTGPGTRGKPLPFSSGAWRR